MTIINIIGAVIGAGIGIAWMNKRKAKKAAEKAQQDEKWAEEQKANQSESPK